jgi:asparagine synthase (glutamine-hydrolysing)
VFLSGGVDSSGVAALMAQAGASPLCTFSVGFADDEGETAELPFARQVAEHLRTDHHEIIVSDADLTDLLPELVWLLDEPHADYAAVPTFLLARAARPHITVALTGEGGDEVFGGYDLYLHPPGPDEPYRGLPRIMNDLDLRTLLTGDFCAALALARGGYLDRLDLATRRHDPLTRCLAADFAGWLPDDLLMKVDRATMGVSLEARVPLLDRKVVEYAAALPPALKVRGKETKAVLKQALDPLLPWQILQRKKQGFTAPLARWLARPAFRAWLRELLLGTRTRQRGYYSSAGVAALLDRNDATMGDASKLWLLACFELWCRQFLDGDRRA